MSMEELQCRLLHSAYAEAQQKLEQEGQRLLGQAFADERELRRALRGIELRSEALATAFQREHPVEQEGTS